MIRLCLVTALPSEASPIVDYFRLSPVKDAPLRTWRRDDVALVASGVGVAAVTVAVGFLAGATGAPRSCAWVNVGIAGHSHLPRGSVVVVDRCARRGGDRSWYPSLPIRTALERAGCITVDAVETAFAEDALYDMECAGFLEAAARFAWLDLVHSVKIVSDGPDRDTRDLDRNTISNLVAAALPRIDGELIDPLLASATPLALDSVPPDLSPWLSRWHFTVSNAHRLREVVDDYVAVHDGRMPDPANFAVCARAADVLTRLRQQVDAEPAMASRC